MNMKGPDYTGHAYGPDSAEIKETLAELDRQMAQAARADRSQGRRRPQRRGDHRRPRHAGRTRRPDAAYLPRRDQATPSTSGSIRRARRWCSTTMTPRTTRSTSTLARLRTLGHLAEGHGGDAREGAAVRGGRSPKTRSAPRRRDCRGDPQGQIARHSSPNASPLGLPTTLSSLAASWFDFAPTP